MRHFLLFFGFTLCLSTAPLFAQQRQQDDRPLPAPAKQQKAVAKFIDAQSQSIGMATLTQMPGGVLIQIEVRGLPPGEHALHIHAVGHCEAQGAFQSASGHFNPDGHQHGFRVQGGPHAGDLPNVFVGQDGTLQTELFNPNVAFGAGRTSLFDADGSAFVIHAKADDHQSQPAGDSGGRIACAVIER